MNMCVEMCSWVFYSMYITYIFIYIYIYTYACMIMLIMYVPTSAKTIPVMIAVLLSWCTCCINVVSCIDATRMYVHVSVCVCK